jgi:transposase
MEDLNLKGLSRRGLARSVSDAGWNPFFTKLSYQAECAGREWGVVDRRGTSQTCGAYLPKNLTGR